MAHARQAREGSKPNRNPKTRVYWVGSNQQKTSQQTHGAPMGYGGKSRPLAPKKQAQGGLGYSGAATRKASVRMTHARQAPGAGSRHGGRLDHDWSTNTKMQESELEAGRIGGNEEHGRHSRHGRAPLDKDRQRSPEGDECERDQGSRTAMRTLPAPEVKQDSRWRKVASRAGV